MRSARNYAAQVLILAGLYLGAARIGLELSVAHGVITPVWIPTGIALAALLVFGYRMWLGVALGAFAANAMDLPLALAAGIAIGNTLEAVLGTFFLRRTGFDAALERTRDVLLFVLFGAVVATGVAATNGVTVLYLGDRLTDTTVQSAWILWWFGDLIGALLVTPALLVWHKQWRARRAIDVPEATVLVATTALAASIVFLGGHWSYPYVLFPLLVWAALRFKQLGAATTVLIIGVIGTVGTINGSVPIGGATETQSVQILQALIAVVGLGVLVIASSIAERDATRAALDDANARMADAQAIANLGSWSWDIPANRVVWSDEMYRIYGYEPQEGPVTFEKAMERVVEEDAGRVARVLEQEFEARRDHTNPDIHYRITLPDGTERQLVGKGAISFGAGGEPLRMVGTVEDVTDVLKAQAEMAEAFAREREAADRLRELDLIKNTFMSAVSHDLRSPLTTIGALSDVLVKRLGDLPREEVAAALGRISGSAARANRVLTNILDVDRLSRGGIEAARGEVDLADLSARVAYGMETDGHQIALPDKRTTAWVDEGLVERIIENLLYNAVRHSGTATKVAVRFEDEPDGIVLIVEDSGDGVPDELKGPIFQAFHRGTTPASGTGVGLFLVAQFAALHGGRAWVEDRAGGGASFRVFFPANEAASAPEAG
jgi:signal transduction histidine kinase